MFGRIKALIRKELLSILRDPKSRILLVGPPLVQLFVFSFAATQEVKNVAIAVYDGDRSFWSQELVRRIDGSPTFTRLRVANSLQEVRPLIEFQEVLLAVHISPAFGADLAAGREAKVQVLLDGRRSNAAQIVQGYVTRVVADLSRDVAREQGRESAAAEVADRSWFNPNLTYRWFTVPSLIAILMSVTGLIVTGLSIARERELATFEQLLVSPLRPIEILIGKTMPAVIVGTAQMGVFVACAVYLLGVPLVGSLGLLLLSLEVFLLSLIGIGLFISSLSMTQQQAILGAFAFLSPAVLLSGFATPVENMPHWLQVIAHGDPMLYMMNISRGIFLKDMPAEVVLTNLWPMAVIALLTLSSAAWLFRHRMA